MQINFSEVNFMLFGQGGIPLYGKFVLYFMHMVHMVQVWMKQDM